MFKKIVLSGLLAGIIMLAVGMSISAIMAAIVPSLKPQYSNTRLFRSMDDPIMALYFVHPFFLGIVLAWIWSTIKAVFSGKSDTSRVWQFAIGYWLVSLSGMLISYSTFQVSFLMVASWTIAIFIESIVVAYLFTKINP